MQTYTYITPERLYNETYPTGSIMMIDSTESVNPNQHVEQYFSNIRREKINGFEYTIVHKLIDNEELVFFLTPERDRILSKYTYPYEFGQEIDLIIKSMKLLLTDEVNSPIVPMAVCIVHHNINPIWIDPLHCINPTNDIIQEYGDLSDAYSHYQSTVSASINVTTYTLPTNPFVGYYWMTNKREIVRFNGSNASVSVGFAHLIEMTKRTNYQKISTNLFKLFNNINVQQSYSTSSIKIPPATTTIWAEYKFNERRVIGKFADNYIYEHYHSFEIPRNHSHSVDYAERYEQNIKIDSIDHTVYGEISNYPDHPLECETDFDTIVSKSVHETSGINVESVQKDNGLRRINITLDQSGGHTHILPVHFGPESSRVIIENRPGTGDDPNAKRGIPFGFGSELFYNNVRFERISTYHGAGSGPVTTDHVKIQNSVQDPCYAFKPINHCYVILRPVRKLLITEKTFINRGSIPLENGMYNCLYNSIENYIYFINYPGSVNNRSITHRIIYGIPCAYGFPPMPHNEKALSIYHRHLASRIKSSHTHTIKFVSGPSYHYHVLYQSDNRTYVPKLDQRELHDNGYADTAYANFGMTVFGGYHTARFMIDDVTDCKKEGGTYTSYNTSLPNYYPLDFFTLDNTEYSVFSCQFTSSTCTIWIGTFTPSNYDDAELIDDVNGFKRYKLINESNGIGWLYIYSGINMTNVQNNYAYGKSSLNGSYDGKDFIISSGNSVILTKSNNDIENKYATWMDLD